MSTKWERIWAASSGHNFDQEQAKTRLLNAQADNADLLGTLSKDPELMKQVATAMGITTPADTNVVTPGIKPNPLDIPNANAPDLVSSMKTAVLGTPDTTQEGAQSPDLATSLKAALIAGQLRKKTGLSQQPFALNDKLSIPEGYEAAGYDAKGNPMVRKIRPNIAEQKFNLEQENNKKQQETKSQLVRNSALDSLKTIGEVEKGMGNFGLFGQLPSIPGTDRANWEANVNKLLSGKIIDLMTSMKEASKTGATGFGQLSEKELAVLQGASTALKRGLAPQDAQRYINDIKTSLQKISQGEQGLNGSEMPHSGGGGQATVTGRVKVKSTDGKIGSIPVNQLQDALAQGYQEVQ